MQGPGSARQGPGLEVINAVSHEPTHPLADGGPVERLCILGGYRLRVLAEGAPHDPSLFYSGTLEREGERVNGISP